MRNIHSLIKTRDPILCIYKKTTTKQTNKQTKNETGQWEYHSKYLNIIKKYIDWLLVVSGWWIDG